MIITNELPVFKHPLSGNQRYAKLTSIRSGCISDLIPVMVKMHGTVNAKTLKFTFDCHGTFDCASRTVLCAQFNATKNEHNDWVLEAKLYNVSENSLIPSIEKRVGTGAIDISEFPRQESDFSIFEELEWRAD